MGGNTEEQNTAVACQQLASHKPGGWGPTVTLKEPVDLWRLPGWEWGKAKGRGDSKSESRRLGV